ncbi:hypothetical protein [Algiphilus sp.]|uniref:hypothetical protein n=1 Tax=Algiphilus sp. TaxID=1872431 RepID=UPI0025C3B2C0|nr:hypothetical protein [Algiphilus sp.]MCK5771090.1 hypothetical protein [Algiphilus sp.]
MTSIVIWPNFELNRYPSMWVVGDTRVSAAGGSPLLEDAAKIFGLPVVCRAPGQDGFFSQVYFEHSFGYCFAGSTLMGQNSYLSLVPLLSNLVSPNRYVPSMSDVAHFALKFIRRTFGEYKERAGPGAMFEAAIFGWCHVNQRLEIWHFQPKVQNDVYEIALFSHVDLQFKDFLYLGDEKQEVKRLIEAAFDEEAAPGRPPERSPRRVVDELIADGDRRSIGGDQQLAIANQFGFQPYTLLRPRVVGQPGAYMSYLGIELNQDNNAVGQAIVGGPGMA